MQNLDLLDTFLEQLESQEVKVHKNISGRDLNTYRLGGLISHVVYLSSVSDLTALSSLIKQNYQDAFRDIPTLTIGKGSNLLIDDNGFDGLCFLFCDELVDPKSIECKIDERTLTANAGIPLPLLARQCVTHGASGLEFYVGIPGTVGGAVAMNAGGHGKQTSDVLLSATSLNLVSGNLDQFQVQDCQFTYRHSRFTSKDLIVNAKYQIDSGDSKEIKSQIDSIVQWRRENQPGGRNVGSVFQNPEDTSAGKLIEDCGLKGYRIGGAYVSEKHANFIQADQDAKAIDVYKLIRYIQESVSEKTGIVLQTEVRFVGMESNG